MNKKYINSLILGTVIGIVICLILPIFVKQYLNTTNLAEWKFVLFGHTFMEYANPSLKITDNLVLWSISPIIMIFAIPVALFNLSLTFFLSNYVIAKN